MTDEATAARYRRAARALQAVHIAMKDIQPTGTFDTFIADLESSYDATMREPDADAMPPACLDISDRGGWAWWAKHILDAADEVSV